MAALAQSLCVLLVAVALTVPFGDGAPIPQEEGPAEPALEGHAGLQEVRREFQSSSQAQASAIAVANSARAAAKVAGDAAEEAEMAKEAARNAQEHAEAQAE